MLHIQPLFSCINYFCLNLNQIKACHHEHKIGLPTKTCLLIQRYVGYEFILFYNKNEYKILVIYILKHTIINSPSLIGGISSTLLYSFHSTKQTFNSIVYIGEYRYIIFKYSNISYMPCLVYINRYQFLLKVHQIQKCVFFTFLVVAWVHIRHLSVCVDILPYRIMLIRKHWAYKECCRVHVEL